MHCLHSWWLRKEGSRDCRAALAITIPPATRGAAPGWIISPRDGGGGKPSKTNSTKDYWRWQESLDSSLTFNMLPPKQGVGKRVSYCSIRIVPGPFLEEKVSKCCRWPRGVTREWPASEAPGQEGSTWKQECRQEVQLALCQQAFPEHLLSAGLCWGHGSRRWVSSMQRWEIMQALGEFMRMREQLRQGSIPEEPNPEPGRMEQGCSVS